jgi:hypothetical protein
LKYQDLAKSFAKTLDRLGKGERHLRGVGQDQALGLLLLLTRSIADDVLLA